MNPLGAAGIAVDGIATALLLAVLAVNLRRGLRVSRLARELGLTGARIGGLVSDTRAALAADARERHRLLRPARQVRRVLWHPLTVALLESFARRRRRALRGA